MADVVHWVIVKSLDELLYCVQRFHCKQVWVGHKPNKEHDGIKENGACISFFPEYFNSHLSSFSFSKEHDGISQIYLHYGIIALRKINKADDLPQNE